MLRSLGSWFGLEQASAGGEPPAGGSPEEAAEAGNEPEQRPGESREGDEEPLLHQAKGLGNYLFNFATAATKKITESVAETAQTIKKSVEEGKIDDIIDKTIIGDFQKEQKKFV